MQPYAIKTVQFIIQDLQVVTPPAETSYRLVGRTTSDNLYNKNITDPSNIVSASQLVVNGTSLPINPGGSPGDSLVLDNGSLSFAPVSGSVLDVVKVNVQSLVLSGGSWYCNFNNITNVIGSSASSFTVSSNVNGGQQLTSTKNMYAINAVLCIQYQNQPGQSRTFFTINVDNVSQHACAESLPISNNWRSSMQGMIYGCGTGSALNLTLITNAIGVITLNSGQLYITVY